MHGQSDSLTQSRTWLSWWTAEWKVRCMFDSLCVARILVLELAFSADSFTLSVHPPRARSHMCQHPPAWKSPEHWQPYHCLEPQRYCDTLVGSRNWGRFFFILLVTDASNVYMYALTLCCFHSLSSKLFATVTEGIYFCPWFFFPNQFSPKGLHGMHALTFFTGTAGETWRTLALAVDMVTRVSQNALALFLAVGAVPTKLTCWNKTAKHRWSSALPPPPYPLDPVPNKPYGFCGR